MKLTILFLFALFTASFCDLSFLQKQKITDLKDHRPLDYLHYFFLTLYDQYNLTEPVAIVNCFDDKTATRFFNSLYELHEIFNDTAERNNIKLHIDYAKLALLLRSLDDSLECAVGTDDFTRLLDALGIKDRHPENLAIYDYIYYQARYNALLQEFIPVVKSLDNNDNKKAAIAVSRVLSDMVSNYKKEGVYFIANQAFGNGIAMSLDIDDPNDSLKCWDNESSAHYLDFFYKLAEAVSEGGWRDSPINTHYFWKEQGEEIFKRIPSTVWDCVLASYDSRNLANALGIDIYTAEFREMMEKWITKNRLSYFMTLKGIKTSFESKNLNRAGNLVGDFLDKVSKVPHNDEEDEKLLDI